MGPGGRRLTFERPDLPTQFAYQVAETLEILFCGGQPPLGTLAPATVLQDPGGLFDDRPAILGTGVQDLVELALSDDDVLCATDSRVRQELLDVEQPARLAVHRVLAVA